MEKKEKFLQGYKDVIIENCIGSWDEIKAYFSKNRTVGIGIITRFDYESIKLSAKEDGIELDSEEVTRMTDFINGYIEKLEYFVITNESKNASPNYRKFCLSILDEVMDENIEVTVDYLMELAESKGCTEVTVEDLSSLANYFNKLKSDMITFAGKSDEGRHK